MTSGLDTTNITHLNLRASCDTKWFLETKALESLRGSKLEYLNLAENMIIWVDDGIFLVLPKSLKTLDLQRNAIKILHFNYLVKLDYLQAFYLNDQMFWELDDWSQGGPILKTNAKRKHIRKQEKLANGQEHHRDYVSQFELQSPNISTSTEHNVNEINVTNMLNFENIQRKCIPLPQQLQYIDLSHSGLLWYLLFTLCSPRNSIKMLNLSDQYDIDPIPSFWKRVQELRMLEKLFIGNNRLTDVPKGTFSSLSRLKVLSFTRNSLVDINFDIHNMVNLISLDLSANRIQYLPDDFTKQLEHIAEGSNLSVHFQDNKLQCKCEQLKFVTWLRYTNVIFEKKKLTCEYRNGSDVSLSQITEIHRSLEAECIALTVIICCTVGFLVLVLILSLISIIHYKRWNFKYLAVLGRKNVNPFHPLEDCRIEMEYDIYISYELDHNVNNEETLHEFVTRSVYPGLKNKGFKVIIREELEIGHHLYNVISDTIRKCRSVVVLLSNDYCKDHWNVFEFNMAAMEGIYTKRQVVIPIAMESIYPVGFHEEVYAFLRQEPISRFTVGMDARSLVDFIANKVKL